MLEYLNHYKRFARPDKAVRCRILVPGLIGITLAPFRPLGAKTRHPEDVSDGLLTESII